MDLIRYVPGPGALPRAVGIVALAGIPVVLTWALVGPVTAESLYAGIMFMIVAVSRLPLAQQAAIAALGAAAAAIGTAIGHRTILLVLAVIAAGAAQWLFNQWSIAVAAQAPAVLMSHSQPASDFPFTHGVAALLGAVLVMAAGLALRIRGRPQPAGRDTAARHAAAFILGCLILVLAGELLDLPHISWGVLAFCLVFLPVREQHHPQWSTERCDPQVNPGAVAVGENEPDGGHGDDRGDHQPAAHAGSLSGIGRAGTPIRQVPCHDVSVDRPWSNCGQMP